MGLNNYTSDHSSGFISGSYTPWENEETWSQFQSLLREESTSRRRSSSLAEIMSANSIDAVMEDFRQNGFDSPYDPEIEPINFNKYRNNTALGGMGPPGMYLRQKSYPAPDSSPSAALPRRRDYKRRSADEVSLAALGAQAVAEKAASCDSLTEQQLLVLASLPDSVLHYLLRELEQRRGQHEVGVKPARVEHIECRFCKNNGERESYYRSHRLRWRGRVTCPVLRAYRCRLCGADGDSAHTVKYCPLATVDERINSGALMRSVRMASGRRRHMQVPSNDVAADYVVFGETTPTVITDGATYNNYNAYEPLDPVWEALATKLML